MEGSSRRWIRPAAWSLAVVAGVVARVLAGGSRGAPLRIVALELALGLVIYSAGLFAIVAPIVVVWTVPAMAWQAWRERAMNRRLAAYLLIVSVVGLGFSGAYWALMVRYGSRPRPTVAWVGGRR